MYIETRFYDNGHAEALLRKHRPVQDPDDNTGKYDFYVDVIGSGEEYETLEAWAETLEIEDYEVSPLIEALESGNWIDITPYC